MSLHVHHAYDPAAGRLIETWTNSNDTIYQYDELGRLATVTAVKLNGQTVNQVTQYAYDAVGDLASELQRDGVRTSYSYDDLNRLTGEVAENTTTNEPVFAQTYELNADGQRKA